MRSMPAGPGSVLVGLLPLFRFILSEIRSSYAFMTVEEMPLPSASYLCGGIPTRQAIELSNVFLAPLALALHVVFSQNLRTEENRKGS